MSQVLRIRSVHLRNIRQFRRNVDWMIPQGVDVNQRVIPRVVYGPTLVDEPYPSEVLLELLAGVAGQLRKGQGRLMNDNTADQHFDSFVIFTAAKASDINKYAESAVRPGAVGPNPKEPVSEVQGLYWKSGITTHFKMYQENSHFMLTYADVRGKSYCTIQIPDREPTFDLSSVSQVIECLSTNLTKDHEHISELKALPQIFTVVNDTDECTQARVRDGECCFDEDIYVKESRLYMGDKHEDQLNGEQKRRAEFGMHLTNILKSTTSEIIIGLHNTVVLPGMIDSLKKHEHVYVILVTQKPELMDQTNYQNISLLKYIFNRKSMTCAWTVSAPAQSISGAGIRKIHSKHNGSKHVLAKELLLLVEGEEDEILLQAWIDEVGRWLSGKSTESFMSKLDRVPEFDEQMKRMLIHMLRGLTVIPVNGKGKFEDALCSFLKVPVPHCICIDADAFFSEEVSAKDILGFTSSQGKEDQSWGIKLPHSFSYSRNKKDKDVTLDRSESVVTKLMRRIENWTKCGNTAYHYPKLHEQVVQQYIPGVRPKQDKYLQERVGENTAVTAKVLFERCENFGHIHTWMAGDGTPSKVVNLEKANVLRDVDPKTIPAITQFACCKPTPRSELLKFVTFLSKTVFNHYVLFNLKMFGGSSSEDEDTLPRVMVEHSDELVKISSKVELKTAVPISEERLQSIMSSSHKKAANEIEDACEMISHIESKLLRGNSHSPTRGNDDEVALSPCDPCAAKDEPLGAMSILDEEKTIGVHVAGHCPAEEPTFHLWIFDDHDE